MSTKAYPVSIITVTVIPPEKRENKSQKNIIITFVSEVNTVAFFAYLSNKV